jgi:F420H(2)-dependent quinone reductase
MTEYPASAVDGHNSKFIAEFRANGGQVSGPQYQGVDLLLLHHTGARSGLKRVTPLAFQSVLDSFAIFASWAGSSGRPVRY